MAENRAETRGCLAERGTSRKPKWVVRGGLLGALEHAGRKGMGGRMRERGRARSARVMLRSGWGGRGWCAGVPGRRRGGGGDEDSVYGDGCVIG